MTTYSFASGHLENFPLVIHNTVVFHFFRFVCADNPSIDQAMEGSHYVTTYDIKSYETMTAISERYNKAVDKLVESVGEIQCSGF